MTVITRFCTRYAWAGPIIGAVIGFLAAQYWKSAEVRIADRTVTIQEVFAQKALYERLQILQNQASEGGVPEGRRTVRPHERRVRVVLTDGERMADFAYLRHAGREVVCGVPDDAGWHMTYPANGRAHYTVRQGSGHTRRFLRERPVPLKSFTGQRTLLALSIASTALVYAGLRPFERQAQG